MPEFIKTAEVLGSIAQKAYGVGKFVIDQLQGGGWSNLPHLEEGPISRPVRASQMAHVEYLTTPPLEIPSNIIIGEE